MKSLIALALLLVAGCSSPCLVETSPEGAKAYVDGELRGTTPCTIELGNKMGSDSWGWGLTDHRTLLLVNERGQFYYVQLRRHDRFGIPFWPESVRHDFSAETEPGAPPAEDAAPAPVVPAP